MEKSVIFMHPHEDKNFCYSIADKMGAEIIFIHAKNALIEFDTFDIVGFGVGYDSGKKYAQLMDFAEKLPNVQNKKAFIFSTVGISSEKRMANDYAGLLNLLKDKGFVIINDFDHKGFNQSSIARAVNEAGGGIAKKDAAENA